METYRGQTSNHLLHLRLLYRTLPNIPLLVNPCLWNAPALRLETRDQPEVAACNLIDFDARTKLYTLYNSQPRKYIPTEQFLSSCRYRHSDQHLS